jgi:hypothetical protein
MAHVWLKSVLPSLTVCAKFAHCFSHPLHLPVNYPEIPDSCLPHQFTFLNDQVLTC